jgi:aryl-alcohol dehydrogenase-like predicted oxidoreductase
VPILSFGTATFGGGNDAHWSVWGNTGLAEAKRLVGICLDAGVNLFDTADAYAGGESERILGAAAADYPRDSLLISSKATAPTGPGPNEFGSSRHALIRACEGSLRRLGTDYLDIYYMHAFDALTPVEETLRALDDLIRGGKVRYIGCSSFSGWHLMKALGVSLRYGWSRYVAHQVHYCLVAREFEWELMPLASDQGVGTVVWSALAGGALAGKIRRDRPPPPDSRMSKVDHARTAAVAQLHDIVDVLQRIAVEIGKTPAQVALNWVLQRPTVSSIVMGARNADQLRQNLGAAGWKLTAAQVSALDRVSDAGLPFPYWSQRLFPQLNPPPIAVADDWAERFPPPAFIGPASKASA